jgi:hypothetical protein
MSTNAAVIYVTGDYHHQMTQHKHEQWMEEHLTAKSFTHTLLK